MKIAVQVKPNSKKESVEAAPDGSYIVRVNAPPVDGKANRRVVEVLAEFFRVSKSQVSLDKGSKSKKKVFEIKL